MKKVTLVLALIAVMQFSCATSKNYVPFNECSIDFLAESQLLGIDKHVIIGEVSIRDTGFSISCDSETVMKEIKDLACQKGADAIYLFDTSYPDMSSTCYQTSARLIKYKK